MPPTDTAMVTLERNWGMVDSALADLDDEALAARPNDQSNSMGWLLWHMTRVVDRFVHTRCQERPELWVTDGWSDKFGMGNQPTESGQGWDAERVAAWKAPSRDVLLGYYEDVKTAAREYLKPLPALDLERHIPMGTPPNTGPIADALGVLVFDNVVHGGQIAYLRGYYRGMGWFV